MRVVHHASTSIVVVQVNSVCARNPQRSYGHDCSTTASPPGQAHTRPCRNANGERLGHDIDDDYTAVASSFQLVEEPGCAALVDSVIFDLDVQMALKSECTAA